MLLAPLSAFVLLWASCADSTQIDSPSTGKKSLRQDYWGHRPGPQGFRSVIIDAGHGGHDPGATAHGKREKTLALDTAHRLKKKLSPHFKVVMIRRSDHFVDLDRRVKLANRHSSAILVSLHYNSSRSSWTRGPETYYWRVDSHGIAKRIQRNLEKATVSSRRSRGLVRRRLRLTRNPRVPCVLVEFGYLSNRSDARAAGSAAYRDKVAAAVANALITQKRIGDAGTGSLPRAINKPPSKASDPPGS